MEQRIEIERLEQAVNIFGSFDENIRLIETEFHVAVSNREGELRISGEPEDAMLAAKAIQALLTLSSRGENIGEQEVRYVIGLARSGQEDRVSELTQDVICITAKGTHLHVELVDAVAAKNPILKKIHKVVTSAFIFLFYVMVTYSGWQLSTKAKQAVSTMPQFRMGQVYVIFVIAGVLCALSALVDLIVCITEKPEGGAEK